MNDIASVTPELEAGCRKLLEGVQLGGPFLPPGYNRLRVQFPGNHGGVERTEMAMLTAGADAEKFRVRCRSTDGATHPSADGPEASRRDR